MPKITIDRNRCKGCLLCVAFCPRSLIKPEKELNRYGVEAVTFCGSDDKCSGCMQCALICPDCCIEVYK